MSDHPAAVEAPTLAGLAPAPVSPPRVPPAPVAVPPETVPVLHLVNGEHYSGAERVQDLLALALPNVGYRVGFASLKPGRFGDHRRSIDASLYEVAMRGRWDAVGAAWRVREIIRDGGYRLLHAHTPRSLAVAAVAARLTGLPLVYHVHSPASRDSTRRVVNWVNDRLERLCTGRIDRMITVSPTLAAHVRARGAPADRLHCVLNGVPALLDNA
ncbi:MAG: glycosyltransferase, partial [Planctomycetota bacterium]